MKDFNKLTNEEVYNLTEADINLYKKLALAENGVKFPVRPECPNSEKIDPDLTIFTIDGLTDRWNGLCFRKIENARNFVDLLIKSAPGICYKSSTYSQDCYLKEGLPATYDDKQPSLNICSEKIYSEEVYSRAKKGIEKFNAEKNAYDKAFAKYKEELAKANEVTAFIDEKVTFVNEDYNRKIYLTRLFVNDYLPIAENNEEMAMKFLKKAYELSEDDEKYILSHKEDKNFKS